MIKFNLEKQQLTVSVTILGTRPSSYVTCPVLSSWHNDREMAGCYKSCWQERMWEQDDSISNVVE